jgi:tRNA ligase
MYFAQLCDDNFEEHVLPYPPHLSGLHLHGLNLNTGNFHTLPSADVASFAREWGFIETPTISLPSIAAVREFADKAAETGSWNGEPVEGFVVRTTVADVPTGATPPYAPGADFFFKIKFEEPYLMYRDWREITRTILSSNSKSKPANIPKGKLRRAESRVYRRWVEREIQRDPDAFEGFGKGKGIIAIRDRFLEWCETDAGKAELTKEKGGKGVDDVGGSDVTKTWEKTIIVPVAVPGCGG